MSFRRGDVERAQESLLTTNETAELLRVAPKTVRAWRARGLLVEAGTLPGGRYLFARTTVEDFLRGARGASATLAPRPEAALDAFERARRGWA